MQENGVRCGIEFAIGKQSEERTEKFWQMMAVASEYYTGLHVSTLDGAKTYRPIFDFYDKYKENLCMGPRLIDCFFGLMGASAALMEKLWFQDETADLGYYTSLSSLYYVLSDESEDVKYRLSLFDSRHMNDPNEGRVLAEYLGKQKREKCTGRSEAAKRWAYDNNVTFLKSFTTNVDSLPMWVQYANGGEGCFVRIDQEMFEKGQKLVESKKDISINNLQEEESYRLYSVAYFDGERFRTSMGKDVTEQVEKIRDIYRQIMEMSEEYDGEMKKDVENVADRILNRVQYLIKKVDYINEKEVRIFFLRSGDEEDIKKTNMQASGMPRIYLNLKVPTEIKEVILGPKTGNGYDKVPYIYWKLQKISGQTGAKVTQSAIEYV